MWRSYLLHIIWLYVRYVRTEDGPMNMYVSIGRAIIYYINQIKCVLYGYHTAYLDIYVLLSLFFLSGSPWFSNSNKSLSREK